MIKPLLGAMVKTADNYIFIDSPGKDIYPFIYRTGDEINCPPSAILYANPITLVLCGKLVHEFRISNPVLCLFRRQEV